MENQQLVSPSLQCTSTPVSFGQRFLLAKNNVTTQVHPQTKSDLVPINFYLFPPLKPAFGQCFCDASVVIKNATEQPKAFKKWLQGKFQTSLQLLAKVYSCTRGLL
jgi:hypothetical protein